jgi:hypothetical protein
MPHWTDNWATFIGNCLVDERRIRYVDYGSGPASLVLLHGMDANCQWWLENIPALLSPDRPICRRHRYAEDSSRSCASSSITPCRKLRIRSANRSRMVKSLAANASVK